MKAHFEKQWIIDNCENIIKEIGRYRESKRREFIREHCSAKWWRRERAEEQAFKDYVESNLGFTPYYAHALGNLFSYCRNVIEMLGITTDTHMIMDQDEVRRITKFSWRDEQ